MKVRKRLTLAQKAGQRVAARMKMRKLKEEQENAIQELSDGGLTLQERKLIEEYLVDFNVRRAMESAGYEKYSSSLAYSILTRPHIKRMIELRKEELKRELAVDQGRMVREYLNIAYAKTTDYFTIDESGFSKFKNWDDLSEDQKAAVSEVSFGINKETGQRYITRIKLFDKMRALEGLAKHLGFFEKDNQQRRSDINVTLEQVLMELPGEVADAVRSKMIQDVEVIEMVDRNGVYGEKSETGH